jgi:asparagine synthase
VCGIAGRLNFRAGALVDPGVLHRMGDLLAPAAFTEQMRSDAVDVETYLRDTVHDVLLDARTLRRGYFREPVVRRLLDDHARGIRDWHSQLWSLLVLELWHRMFVDHRPEAAPSFTPVTVRGAAAVAP